MTERTFSSANRFNPRVFSRVHLSLPHTKCEMSVDIFHIVRLNLLLLIISKKFHFPILSVDYTVYFYFSGDGKNSGVDHFLIRLSSSSYSKQNSLGKITV